MNVTELTDFERDSEAFESDFIREKESQNAKKESEKSEKPEIKESDI